MTLNFRQTIGANDALRTGSYSKTLTFTLSTTAAVEQPWRAASPQPRRSPQTFSPMLLVNSSSFANSLGSGRDVSLNATVPGLHAHLVGEDRAGTLAAARGAARPAATSSRVSLRASSRRSLGISCLRPVARHRAVVGDEQPQVRVAVGAAAVDEEQVGGRGSRSRPARARAAARRASHDHQLRVRDVAQELRRRHHAGKPLVDRRPVGPRRLHGGRACPDRRRRRRPAAARACARTPRARPRSRGGAVRARASSSGSSSGPSAPNVASAMSGGRRRSAETISDRPV